MYAIRSYYAALYVPLIRMAVAVGFGGVLLLGSYWVLGGTGIISYNFV